MAVVVEQTIPFKPETLDLNNSSRWNTLFSLIRPTVKTVQTPKGQNILVDTAKAKGKWYMHIIASVNAGNFSSKLLHDKHVTGIITERRGAGILTAEDLPHTLQSAGFDLGPGVVLVRAGKERRIDVYSPGVIEVQSQGELEQDHILHLLGTATGGTRSNPHQMAEMLKGFIKSASSAHSTFHIDKEDGNPAILHADGANGFEKARHAVERDLRYAMKAHTAQEEDVVYSVHFSDVNGLSRLENYIVAGEIAKYLDSQNVKYALSHSTILNHSKMARGFSISICPIPVSFLEPSAKSQPHKSVSAAGPTSYTSKTVPASESKIPFNDTDVRKRIESGCNAVIKAEPTITEYDTIVGDGDCGYTLRDGVKKVLDFIKDKDLSRLPEILGELVRELEVNMGGTSGALYCIYLTALANALATEPSIPAALKAALEQLCWYTNARVGDRTMMDALIPFIDTLAEEGGDEKAALNRAREGVDGTKKMEAKLGRSTYLDESATRGVPDPGAYGLLVLFGGMCLVERV